MCQARGSVLAVWGHKGRCLTSGLGVRLWRVTMGDYGRSFSVGTGHRACASLRISCV